MTGRVAPGMVGEVTVQIRGGSESFYAYASDPAVIIDKGVKVTVDDYQPPLIVYVSPVVPTPPVGPTPPVPPVRLPVKKTAPVKKAVPAKKVPRRRPPAKGAGS